MPGIDWITRRDTHTRKAIDYARSIDFPSILLVIHYPCMGQFEAPPAYYYLDVNGVAPISRKDSLSKTGMKILYLPNGSVETIYV